MDAARTTLSRQSLCVTCLSQDRKLFPVEDSKSHSLILNLSEGDQLCWECNFFVLKLAAFRRRAARAEALLAGVLKDPINVTEIKSLSNLKMSPTYVEVSLETPEISIKTEDTVKEECENTYDEYTEDPDTKDVSCDVSIKEDSFITDSNEHTETTGDEADSSEEMGDDDRADADLKNENIISTTEEMSEEAKVIENWLPTKSQQLYDRAYQNFMAWRLEQQASSFSENLLLAYFKTLIGKFKPSSLWTEYSKLKSTLNIYHKADISKYSKLLALLKGTSEGFKAKKAKTFSPADLKKFIDEAPDYVYLLNKVAVIFGIMGACRRQELHNLKISDIIDARETLVVNVMKSKNRIDRTFTITGESYKMCKKYLALRPSHCHSPNFFLRYMKGKCVAQNIGINTFGMMGKTVAAYLGLPNPELYTGHCFRRTSATLIVEADGGLRPLKRARQLT